VVTQRLPLKKNGMILGNQGNRLTFHEIWVTAETIDFKGFLQKVTQLPSYRRKSMLYIEK
jgi:hypothetical protein